MDRAESTESLIVTCCIVGGEVLCFLCKGVELITMVGLWYSNVNANEGFAYQPERVQP